MNVFKEHLEKLKYILRLVNDDYYQGTRIALIKWQKLSKRSFIRCNVIDSLEIQIELQKIIEEYEQNVTEGRRKGRSQTDQTLKDGYMIMADRNKLIAGAYRNIVDGYAWRKLKFDKGVIRILSQGQSPGAGPKEGHDAEINHARRMARSGGDVLLHDPTTYLLVGDMSLLSKKKKIPYLGEVKKGLKYVITPKRVADKIEKNQPVSKQQLKLLQAQTMIMTDKIYVGEDVEVQHVRFSEKVGNFHKEVEEIINEARRKGLASAKISEYLTVDVLDLIGGKLDEKVLAEQAKGEKKLELPYSNYDSLVNKRSGEPVRGIVPYTIFPFKAENVVDLMMGNVYLHAGVDLEALKHEFDNRGWSMQIDENQEDNKAGNAERFGGQNLFEDVTLDEMRIKFVHKETQFTIFIGFEILIYIGYQFFDIDAVLAPLENRRKEIVNMGQSTSGYNYSINEYERKFWQ